MMCLPLKDILLEWPPDVGQILLHFFGRTKEKQIEKNYFRQNKNYSVTVTTICDDTEINWKSIFYIFELKNSMK